MVSEKAADDGAEIAPQKGSKQAAIRQVRWARVCLECEASCAPAFHSLPLRSIAQQL